MEKKSGAEEWRRRVEQKSGEEEWRRVKQEVEKNGEKIN